MGKFSTRKAKGPTPVVVTTTPAVTYNGGAGYLRDPKGELFTLAVVNMVSEDTFYESGKTRDSRFVSLIHQIATTDPDWVARFVPFLRNEMNMRSASIAMAAELVHAKLTRPCPASIVTNREVIASAIVRADEPAEMIAYWRSQYGRNLPQPVKRGVADAIRRLYNERNVIKYDANSATYRFGDVIDIVHPEPVSGWQANLFRFCLDNRHGRDTGESKINLRVLARNDSAMAMPADKFKSVFSAAFAEECGLTWEQASSKYGKLDAAFWNAMIPNMGIFALVRNLRNFESAGISKEMVEFVVGKLNDRETIRKSRMLPLRFYSAHKHTNTFNYSQALENALNLSLENIPSFKGKTLVLVDTSGSMAGPLSAKSDLNRMDASCMFGAAIALNSEQATLVSYSSTSKVIPFSKGASVLKVADSIHRYNSGTQYWAALQTHYRDDFDRVVVITDEQTSGWGYNKATTKCPVYTFSVGGYRVAQSQADDKNFTFAGLSDAAFKMIELLERGRDQKWPF